MREEVSAMAGTAGLRIRDVLCSTSSISDGRSGISYALSSEGGGTQLVAARALAPAAARAKPVLFEASAAEFTGFERERRSWVPPEMSSAE